MADCAHLPGMLFAFRDSMVLTLLHTLAMAVFVSLAVLVLARRQAGVGKVAPVFLFALAIWAWEGSVTQSDASMASAAAAVDVGVIGWASVMSTFLWLTLVFTGQKRALRMPGMWLLLALPPVYFILTQWFTGHFSVLVRHWWGWGNVWPASPTVILFYVYHSVFALVGVVLLIVHGQRNRNSTKRWHSWVLAGSTLLVLVLAFVVDVVLPQTGFNDIPNIGDLLALLWAGGVTYAIAKHKVLEINPTTAAQDIIDTMSDCLLLLDQVGQVVFVNQAGLELLGYVRSSDLMGKSIEEIVAIEHGAARLPSWVHTQRLANVEAQLRSKRGDAIPAIISVTPMNDSYGDLVGAVCVAKDISRYQQAQKQILQSDRLASVGMLAAGVAHEINNPLAYVMANLGHITTRMDEIGSKTSRWRTACANGDTSSLELEIGELATETEDLIEASRDALQGSARIRDIVCHLKTFSGGHGAQEETVDINAVIEAAVNMANNQIKYRARLVKDLGAVLPVRANEGRLCQVFVNILVNAAQAIDEGRASENEVRIASRSEGSRVIIEIEDSGHGIAEENLKHIFDPFFTTAPAGGGTGLGLSISHNIVTMFGGTLEVARTSAKGTLFVIELPHSEMPQIDGAPASQPHIVVEERTGPSPKCLPKARGAASVVP